MPSSADMRRRVPSNWNGRVTTATHRAPASRATSATMGAAVGLAWIWHREGRPVSLADVNEGSFEVRVGGREVPARFSTKPLYDPSNERVRI